MLLSTSAYRSLIQIVVLLETPVEHLRGFLSTEGRYPAIPPGIASSRPCAGIPSYLVCALLDVTERIWKYR